MQIDKTNYYILLRGFWADVLVHVIVKQISTLAQYVSATTWYAVGWTSSYQTSINTINIKWDKMAKKYIMILFTAVLDKTTLTG